MSKRLVSWHRYACAILRAPTDGRVLLVRDRAARDQWPDASTSAEGSASSAALVAQGLYEPLPPGVWGFPSLLLQSSTPSPSGATDAARTTDSEATNDGSIVQRWLASQLLPSLVLPPSKLARLELYDRLQTAAFGSDGAKLSFYLAHAFDQQMQQQHERQHQEHELDCWWTQPSEALALFAEHKARFRCETLHVLRALDEPDQASRLHCERLERLRLSPDAEPRAYGEARPELVADLECVPVPSQTIPPFDCTTLTMVSSAQHAASGQHREQLLLVDPGAAPEAREAFRALLRARLPAADVRVFLTHHHIDHIAALSVVQDEAPHAEVLAHPLTLERLPADLAPALPRVPCLDQSEIVVGRHRTYAALLAAA